jgi:hypothetical protein
VSQFVASSACRIEERSRVLPDYGKESQELSDIAGHPSKATRYDLTVPALEILRNHDLNDIDVSG